MSLTRFKFQIETFNGNENDLRISNVFDRNKELLKIMTVPKLATITDLT